MIKQLLVAGIAFASLGAGLASAQESPVGLWKSMDEETGKPKALIRITENEGLYRGRIEKLFLGPDQEPNPVCDKCEGPRKNQPIIGMTILSDMQKQDARTYGGGQILDPANGKVYDSMMTLGEDANQLDVRGYIGMPMLGRSQTWKRVE